MFTVRLVLGSSFFGDFVCLFGKMNKKTVMHLTSTQIFVSHIHLVNMWEKIYTGLEKCRTWESGSRAAQGSGDTLFFLLYNSHFFEGHF